MYDLKNPSFLARLVEMVDSTENQERIDRHSLAYQIANGDQRTVITKKLESKYPESYDEMTIISLSIAGKILRKLSRAYSAGCRREVINTKTGLKDEELTNLFGKIHSNVSEIGENLNDVMMSANKLYSNHLYVELFSYLSPDNLIRVKPLPQHLFTALPNQSKTKAEVICFKQDKSSWWDYERYIDYEGINPNYRDSETVGIYTVWSKEESFSFARLRKVELDKVSGDEGVIFTYAIVKKPTNKDGINPYNIFPFSSVKQAMDGQFYPYGNEIAQTSSDINTILSDIVSIASLQGYGQAVIYYDADTPPKIEKTGPTHVISIPNKGGNSRFEFANPNPDLKGHLDIALAITRILLTTNDLTTDKVAGELSATNFASAIDRLIADSEIIENIEDQRKKYVVAENNLFDIHMAQLNYLKNNKIWPKEYPEISSLKLDSDKYKIKTYFNTVKPLTTEKEKASTIVYLDENGFILPHEKHMMFNDNMTETEATKRLEAIQKHKMESQEEEFIDHASKSIKGIQSRQPIEETQDRVKEDGRGRQGIDRKLDSKADKRKD